MSIIPIMILFSNISHYSFIDECDIPILFVSIFSLVLFSLIVFAHVSTTVSAADRNVVAFFNFFP